MPSNPTPTHCRFDRPPAKVDGARVLVMGLGRFGGGVGVARWLVDQGAHVTVTDQADGGVLEESIRRLGDCALSWKLGGHDTADLDAVDFVVVNPAVDKRHSPFFEEILERRLPWTTEINLFCERCVGTVVGITGSYGKSTTCAMLAAVLERWCAGLARPYRKVFLGGNIGRSLLCDLPRIEPASLVVLELSNAQLEDLPRIEWAPPIAVINNIRPHHLDRYPDYQGYVQAKLNVVRDPTGRSRVFYGDLEREAMTWLRAEMAGRLEHLIPVVEPVPAIELRVPGAHNRKNADAAYAVCRHLGVDDASIRDSLSSFEGLSHRLEFVRSIRGVEYVNDSKATSPEAMLASIEALEGPCVLLTGGQDKLVVASNWVESVVRACRAVVCVGETRRSWADAFHAAIRNAAAQPQSTDPERSILAHERVYLADDLENALDLARAVAKMGDFVLFSPGAPSFDRYANFAERGDRFKAMIERL